MNEINFLDESVRKKEKKLKYLEEQLEKEKLQFLEDVNRGGQSQRQCRHTVLSSFKTSTYSMKMKQKKKENIKIQARKIKMHEKPITAMT